LTLGIRKQKSSAFIDIGALNQHGWWKKIT
jgi:hypothetical protein